MIKHLIIILSIAALAFTGYASTLGGQTTNEKILELAEEYGDNFVQSSTCGGALVGLAGAINFKLNEPLTPYETCVWTIVTPKRKAILVQVLEEGFSFCDGCEVIQIYNMTLFEFQPAQLIKRNDRNIYNISGSSIFQIAFARANHNTPTGFSLIFQGTGNNVNATADFSLPDSIKVLEPNGLNSIAYPEVGNQYPMNEFVSLTLHPEQGKRIALTIVSHYSIYAVATGRAMDCSFPRSVIYVTEVAWLGAYESRLGTRFRECKNTDYNTTIYSDMPLVVSYFTPGFTSSNYGKFELSWVTV